MCGALCVGAACTCRSAPAVAVVDAGALACTPPARPRRARSRAFAAEPTTATPHVSPLAVCENGGRLPLDAAPRLLRSPATSTRRSRARPRPRRSRLATCSPTSSGATRWRRSTASTRRSSPSRGPWPSTPIRSRRCWGPRTCTPCSCPPREKWTSSARSTLSAASSSPRVQHDDEFSLGFARIAAMALQRRRPAARTPGARRLGARPPRRRWRGPLRARGGALRAVPLRGGEAGLRSAAQGHRSGPPSPTTTWGSCWSARASSSRPISTSRRLAARRERLPQAGVAVQWPNSRPSSPGLSAICRLT